MGMGKRRGLPLDLLRMVFMPDRELLGFLMVVANKPEVMYELLSFLVKNNVRLLYANMVARDGEVELTVFLDVSEIRNTLEGIVKGIAKIENVKKVNVIKPVFKGLIVDTVHFPILLLKERAWVAGKSMSKGLFKDMKVEFGEAGKVFLYHLGVKFGEDLYEYYRKYVSSGKDMLTLIPFLAKAVGWGVIEEIKPLLFGRYRVKIYDNIECETCKPSNEMCGHFSRGMLAGLLSKIAGREMVVEEVKCIARGDPYCEFIAKPKE